MKTINNFFGIVTNVTISQWTNTKGGMQSIRDGKTNNLRIDGNVRLYMVDVKLNPFTKEPMLDADGNPRAGLRSFVIEVRLSNIRAWVDSTITSATAGAANLEAIRKIASNSEVYHIDLATTPVLERTINVTEVTEVLEEEHLAIEYNKERKSLAVSRKKNGIALRTNTMHFFASEDLGITVDQAERSWHGNWATQSEILTRCAEIKARIAQNAPKSNGNNKNDNAE